MKKILISIFSFIYLFLLGTPLSSVNVVFATEEPIITINQSVDEDLKAFNFDYEKYQVNKDLCYRPIIINFNESTSEDYMDLLYVYDPNNQFNLSKITYHFAYGESLDNYLYFYNWERSLFLSGTSSDGTIKRYAMNGYTFHRNEATYRLYYLNTIIGEQSGSINEYPVDSTYLFQNSNSLTYSNCMNIRLEDSHNWSWHFDEDTSFWENFKDAFLNKDTLKDQLFYSFYIPDKWNVYNIQSIDLKYKKCLLEGNRYNVADTGNTHDFYQNSDDELYGPNFYKWKDTNTKDNYDTSELLGHSISEVGNLISYTYDTILPEDKESIGMINQYKWNSIQNLSSFEKAFGKDSEIYKFASQYMTHDNENYWIINFDEYWYSYDEGFYPLMFGNKSFEKYCYDSGLETRNANDFGEGFDYYSFIEEYVFDIEATSITYEDSLNVTRTLPTSVAPVMEKEGSGGDSDTPSEIIQDKVNDLKNDYDELMKIIGFILIVLLIIGILSSLSKIKKTIQLNKIIRNNKKNKK